MPAKDTEEMRLDCDQPDPSALSRRLLAHGEGFLGGSWAQSVANNAEMDQSLVRLPVHMGNVGLNLFGSLNGENHRHIFSM